MREQEEKKNNGGEDIIESKLDFMSFTKLSIEKFICSQGAFLQSFTKISFSEKLQ
jgi:hypothetical protein